MWVSADSNNQKRSAHKIFISFPRWNCNHKPKAVNGWPGHFRGMIFPPWDQAGTHLNWFTKNELGMPHITKKKAKQHSPLESLIRGEFIAEPPSLLLAPPPPPLPPPGPLLKMPTVDADVDAAAATAESIPIVVAAAADGCCRWC